MRNRVRGPYRRGEGLVGNQTNRRAIDQRAEPDVLQNEAVPIADHPDVTDLFRSGWPADDFEERSARRQSNVSRRVGLHVTRIGAKRRRCAFPTRASRDERHQDRREGGNLDQPCADATATVRSGTRRHGYGRWDSRCSAGWDEATMAWRR